jgi:hypothetical protein
MSITSCKQAQKKLAELISFVPLVTTYMAGWKEIHFYTEFSSE